MNKKRKPYVAPIREKYWKQGGRDDIDFHEISSAPENMEYTVGLKNPSLVTVDEDAAEKAIRARQKKERLISKIVRAAKECLAPVQLQIWSMRYFGGLKEVEIASRLEMDQAAVSRGLKVANYKIQLKLRVVKKTKIRKVN
jgi:DNA-directed RNA polymerase specialized sigma subunit